MRCRPVQYVEYVPEVTQHPDYDKAIEALKMWSLAGKRMPVMLAWTENLSPIRPVMKGG